MELNHTNEVDLVVVRSDRLGGRCKLEFVNKQEKDMLGVVAQEDFIPPTLPETSGLRRINFHTLSEEWPRGGAAWRLRGQGWSLRARDLGRGLPLPGDLIL